MEWCEDLNDPRLKTKGFCKRRFGVDFPIRHSCAEPAPDSIRGRNPGLIVTWIPFSNGMTDAVRHLDAGSTDLDFATSQGTSNISERDI